MTVAELIRELQAMPNQQTIVRIEHPPVWHHSSECLADAFDEEAGDVRYEGVFVLIRSK